MRHSAWVVSVVVPVAVVAWAAWPYAPAPAAGGDLAVAPPGLVPDSDPRLPTGSTGCAAAACHGGPAGDALARGGTPAPDIWKIAATHWYARDPHTRAYSVLDGDLARSIMAKMGGGAATEDSRCLACHTNPALAPAAPAGVSPAAVHALRREGVSCEACHGNAGGWLYEHTTWYDHRPATTTMASLNDVGDRALACAGCHVGAAADPARGYPVRDMNHDMIAAGHPRLNFDFADYQRRLPPHWHERDRSAPGTPPRGPDFEAKAWLVGRVAHAEAAARLLSDRARRATENDPGTPWPEFAEFSCVSCHHGVGGNDFPTPQGGRKLGRPPWQPVWPVTRPGDLVRLSAFTAAPVAASEVSVLLADVQKVNPLAARLADQSTRIAALHALGRQVAAAPGPAVRAAVGRLLTAAVANPPPDFDRDAAWQVFHGLAAAERARIADGGAPNPAFATVREKLLLPPGTTLRFDAPPDMAAEFGKLLK